MLFNASIYNNNNDDINSQQVYIIKYNNNIMRVYIYLIELVTN